MSDEEKLDAIENLPDNSEHTSATMGQREGTVSVTNDHSLDDVKRDNDFAATSHELAKEKTKRRSKPLLVLLLALMMAALGGVAALTVYKAYIEKPAPVPASTTTQTTQSTTAPKLTATSVLSKITPGYTVKNDAMMQAIKVAGYDYFTTVMPAAAAQKEVAYNQSSVETATIAKSLKEMGFAETIVQPGTDADSMYVAHYSEKDVVCRVTTIKTYNNPAGKHLVEAGCQDMTVYTANAKSLQPFYELFPTSFKVAQLALIGTPSQAQPSKSTGYTTLQLGSGGVDEHGEAGAGGAAQLFYQTPDKTWHYFTGTQQVLPCSSYNTLDLKKAYLGEKCDNNGTESTVAI